MTLGTLGTPGTLGTLGTPRHPWHPCDPVSALYLIASSRAVRASVRSSRYFTMIGVAIERPHSRALPPVSGLVPGTTTAPSGTVSGAPDGWIIRSFGKS